MSNSIRIKKTSKDDFSAHKINGNDVMQIQKTSLPYAFAAWSNAAIDSAEMHLNFDSSVSQQKKL